MAGLYFEQLLPGHAIEHAIRRTVTETDNVLFTTMTMNPAQIHLDADYCAGTEFGQPLVNSIFTLGLMIGLSVGDTTLGTTVANLGMTDVTFPSPVFVGDTIRARTTVAEARPSKSRADAGIVTFEHQAFNQKDQLVARCLRAALMLRAPV
ncbi:MaoC family dehydratase [Sphingobium sp.]|jgi:acyl dehydratase|uniref:MaoC family dehydratase n=1 Tax=Sphingobium sp. TaxID=1912891 RepID=UPI002C178DF2|nr:MaoC family dehydratase [Sphingobium sp.]HUD93493.1 MaoC family dehydratase [Sphingobium sp.]